ncbi:redox-regulated ATPase YchF [Corynebacterium lizhenjunii]|uniref:Ribosome-binding ATPase YchF n=1 Tax=Corynebacterium lizhenjunii TaxID=2709394 RepID=A0A7T0KG00_9CORY|nr:redox-regulated ATPase YchF [Corynebacterium lizhenjunii]QPK79897.1 redox-regulated ATPase YchF [Corynebacterium lizhenjunii]
MSLTLGIVGLPNVGKSTLFNALTRSDILAANYPFATIEPNVGLVELADARLNRLAEIFGSERILPATVSFVDIAGIVEGASKGEGMGNAFLANIREADAICQVVRAFADENVIHVDGKVDPAHDISVINTELILADLQTIEKALPRLEKEARKNKDLAETVAATKQAQEILEDDRTLFAAAKNGEIDLALVRELHLMTAKPFLYVFNSDEAVLADSARRQELAELVAPAECVFLDAQTETELLELDEEEAMELLEAVGQTEPGLATLARAGFATLGLQTYLTAGPKEARAWTIKQGSAAPQAAGVIHTDFEKKFIKAEIVSFEDLDAAGSMAQARTEGKVRQEGKDYIMCDGDVCDFKIGG